MHLSSEFFPVIFFNSNHLELNELFHIRKIASKSVINVISSTQKIPSDITFDLINELSIHKLLSTEDLLNETIEEVMMASYAFYLEEVEFLNIKNEFAQKNKYLENLNEDLEKIIFERTTYLQESNNEQLSKIEKERNLLKFIKDFSRMNSVEDCLMLLVKETKIFHNVDKPLLVCYFSENYSISYSFQKNTYREIYSHNFFKIDELESDRELPQMLANYFARPFGRILKFEVNLRLLPKAMNISPKVYLFFENSFSQNEIDAFQDFINDRLQILSMILDKVFLENSFLSESLRWEKTFDAIVDPLAIIDRDFNIVRANKQFTKKFINRKCYQAFAARSTPCENCPLVSSSEQLNHNEVPIYANGKEFHLSSAPFAGLNAQKTNHVIHKYQDITDSKRLYLRMLQSEKMGAIGVLAGNIAHELNNPLTGIRSLVQILKNETNSETLKSDFFEIEKATARSQQIIKNLLDFSSDKPLGMQKISVDQVIASTLPMLKTVTRFYRTEILLNAENYLVEIEPNMLQQVIFNLINNACQAMKNSGTLTIRSYLSDKMIVISIADTGPGIPPEIQAQIFTPFFTTKKEGVGTGLGLSIAKNIIEKFKGQLELESTVGQGTTFYIKIPQAEVDP